jgi:hypothetical protein
MWKEWPHLPITVGVSKISKRARYGALTESTVIAWELAGRTSSIELNATDTADFILWHVPAPGGDGVPRLDGNFHDVSMLMKDSLKPLKQARVPADMM